MKRARGLLYISTCWLFVAAAIALSPDLAAGLTQVPSGPALETALGIIALAVVLTAIVAGRERREAAAGLALVALYFVVASLPDGSGAQAVAAIPIGALVAGLMLAVGLWQAHRATRQLLPPAG